MKAYQLKIAFALYVLFLSNGIIAQSFLNGSFENTTAPANCQYNLSNATFNSFMSNANAYGAGQEIDIVVSGCSTPLIPDGSRAIALAHVPVDEVALNISPVLTIGSSYTITFWVYSSTARPQGNIEIGASTLNNTFGTSIYVGNTIPNTWTNHSFTFTATNAAAFITVRNVVDGIIHWNFIDHFEMITNSININLGNDTTLCQGQSLLLDATTANSSYLWQDNSTNSTFNVTQPGTYWVQVTNVNGVFSDTININYNPIPLVNLGNDTTLCPGETILLDATTANANYLWQDNSTNSTFNVTQAGTYLVEVSLNNCSSFDTINVFYTALPIIFLGNDTTLCIGESLLLDVTNTNATYVWQDNSTNSTFNVTQSGNYYVQVSINNCSISDSIDVSFSPIPVFSLGNDTTLCQGEFLMLNVTTANATYVWQDNSTNPTFNVSQPGTYSVEINVNNCSAFDTILINYNPIPLINLGSDTTLCPNDSLLLDVTIPNAIYSWQDNSSGAIFTVSQSGIYTVEVILNNCIAFDTIQVNYWPILFADLGNDTTLCLGETLILNANSTSATYIWQDNSTDSTFFVEQPGIYFVEINSGNCSLIETILVEYEDCEVFILLPNVFTPNNDGINDIFTPIISKGIVSMNTTIYNRWGTLVFESNHLNIDWKGEDVSDGTYYWIINYTDIKGNNASQNGYVSKIK